MILKALREFWIIPVALTTSAFVVFIVSLYMPQPSMDCFKPNVLCEPSPIPMFAGLGSIVGVLVLYAMIRPEINDKDSQRSTS